MKILNVFRALVIFLIFPFLLMGLYLVGGWVISIILNPILRHFGANTITPMIGASIILFCEIVGKLIK